MEINYLIAHNINIHEESPIYADKLTFFNNLKNEEKEIFTKYFTSHIDKQRTNNRTKPAIFILHEGEVPNQTIEYIKNFNEDVGTDVILQNTKNLTHKLHQTMKGISRSDGILLFVHYSYNSVDFLSIMKMDPETGMKFNKENNILEIINDMLPNSSKRLHKVAFFNLENVDDEEYKFHVLDKQQTDDNVSNFFIDKFLEAKLEFDDKKVNTIFSQQHNSLIDTLQESGIDDSGILDQIYKQYKALFYRDESILITEEVKSIIDNQIRNEERSESITTSWANNIINTYGNDVYFEFHPSPVNKFDSVYTDEDNKITLKFEADLDAQKAVSLEETDESFIIRIDKSVVKNFGPRN